MAFGAWLRDRFFEPSWVKNAEALMAERMRGQTLAEAAEAFAISNPEDFGKSKTEMLAALGSPYREYETDNYLAIEFCMVRSATTGVLIACFFERDHASTWRLVLMRQVEAHR
jgi:hypothetical protein